MKRLTIKRQGFITEQIDEIISELNKRGIQASREEVHCLCDMSNWMWPDDCIESAVDQLLRYAEVT
jgi:hypothetical protein